MHHDEVKAIAVAIAKTNAVQAVDQWADRVVANYEPPVVAPEPKPTPVKAKAPKAGRKSKGA